MSSFAATDQQPAVDPTVPRPWPLLSTVLAIALISLGLAWETALDPIRPGGSWLALKVVPLVLALRGLHQGRIYTFKWMSLVIWIYVGEALVRIVGLTASERLLAGNSLALSLGLAITILAGARAQIKIKKRLISQAQQLPG